MSAFLRSFLRASRRAIAAAMAVTIGLPPAVLAQALPVVDLSGVWIARSAPETFGVGDNAVRSPSGLFTLTLERRDISVSSSGAASVRIDYDMSLVVDGYTAFDPDPNDFVSETRIDRCQRSFIDSVDDGRPAYSITLVERSAFAGTADYDLNLDGVTSNPTYTEQAFFLEEDETAIDLVVKGRRLDMFGVGPNFPGALSEMCRPAERQGSGSSGQTRLRFVRIASATDASASGVIEGNVRAAEQTQTETENEVQRFRIQLLRQPDGSIRRQGPSESNSDYLAFLETAGARVVAELNVEPDEEGNYPFGSPGAYRFEGVPLLQAASTGGYRVSHYTVLVTNGQSDEFVLDDQNMIVPGATSPLLFGRGFASNLIPDQSVPLIELAALDAIPAKRDLVARLIELCETNYTPAEAPVTAFLDQLEGGTLALTDERNEALRRAVWAERAAVSAVALADQLLEEALAGLGTAIADAWDDLTDLTHKKLSEAQKSVENAGQATPPAGLNPPPLAAKAIRDIVEGDKWVKRSAKAGTMLAAFKATKPLIETLLGEAVNDPAKVEELTGPTSFILISILSLVKSGSLAGGSKPLIKKLIEEAIGASKPLFLDANGTFSYCSETAEDLAYSATQMEAWDSVVPGAYATDRQAVVEAIARLNAGATDALVQAQLLLGLGSGLDAAQDGAAVFGDAGVKQAKALEKVIQASKYISNVSAFVTGIQEVFVDLPAGVEVATRAAYGEQVDGGGSLVGPSFAGGPRQEVPGGELPRTIVTVPNFSPYLTALTDVTSALEADDLTALVGVVSGDGEDDLPRVRSDWNTGVVGYSLRVLASAAAGDRVDLAFDYANLEDYRLEVLSAEVDLEDVLIEIIEDALSGEYEDEQDLDYLAAKARAKFQVETLRDVILAYGGEIDAIRTTLNAAPEGDAAYLEILSIESEETGSALVTQSPERFTVTARVDNLSPGDLSGVSALLEVFSPEESITIIGDSEVSVGSGTLGADDDSGDGDEAEVTWTVEYAGDFAGEAISLTVDLLENGAEADFITTGAEELLFIAPEIGDRDLDSMPNDFEEAFGLNPDVDDATGDLDQDGIDNETEYRIGTAPDDNDTDDDGATDGEEIIRGQDGEITDPLVADSDGDGTDDGADGAPNDATTTEATISSEEPVVSLSEESVRVAVDAPFVEISVSNGGDGILFWAVETDDADRIVTIPEPGAVSGGDSLLVTLASGYDFPAGVAEKVSFRVVDAAGSEVDSVEVEVTLGVVTDGADCGDADDSGGSGESAQITATDALQTLTAAVGSNTCELCRCDVDASGAITATDALAVLSAAVGISVGLVCAPCS